MTAPAPRIGITTYGVHSKSEFSLPAGYVAGVRRAGGLPLLLPPGETAQVELTAWLDGLILAGGGDIAPQRYGGADHPLIYNVDPERDESEERLARCALAQRLPTLAICRGLQVMNVACGGTLHSHLPDRYGEQVLHRAPPREPVVHELLLERDSRLAGLLETDRCLAPSWHHQAIDRPADGFRVVARAPDGVIEAVELPDHPEVICVQWHPELAAERDALQQRLFDELVRQARAYRESCPEPAPPGAK